MINTAEIAMQQALAMQPQPPLAMQPQPPSPFSPQALQVAQGVYGTNQQKDQSLMLGGTSAPAI